MKKLIDKLFIKYRKSTLETKIRYSYLVILIPLALLVFFSFVNMWSINRKYSDMIESIVKASEFSLDFKKDFDYETYLVIVGNKTFEESGLDTMLSDAEGVVKNLETITEGEDNRQRLESVKKYLKNLRTYTEIVKENLQLDNLYEKNIEIWENDIQIVTSLVADSIYEYIYYDIKEIQIEQKEYVIRYSYLITIAVVAFLVVGIVLVFFSYYIPSSISKPILEVTKVTNQVANGDLSVRSDVFDGVEPAMLSKSINAMIDKINELLSQVTTEQVRLRKAEFELLQAQINPHFLYNTLDAIVWLAEAGDKEKVVSTVGSLSDFFRASLNQGKDIVTIKEDIGHVRSYLKIQQVRYQDILEYEIDVPEELNNYLIPKITIQPLVENALYHGIKNKRGLGKIEITGQLYEDYLELYIKDNGLGITDERLKVVLDNVNNRSESEKTSFGLYNVNERIKLDFGDIYGISISSKYHEGTLVTIKLPLQTTTE